MKLTLPRIHLNSALAIAGRVAATKSPIPTALCVLIATDDQGEVRLEATNLELHVVVRLGKATRLEEGGAVAVNARSIAELTAALGGGEVSLAEDERAKRLLVKSGQSNYRLMLNEADEFLPVPELTNPLVMEFPKAALSRLIDSTVYAMAADATNPLLFALNLRVESVETGQEHHDAVLTVYATDTHRMARAVAIGCHVSGSAEGFSVLLPANAAKELQKLLAGEDMGESVTVAVDDNQFHASVGALDFYARLLNQKAGNYARVIPASYAFKAVIARDELQGALRRLRLVTKANQAIPDYSAWWVRDEGHGPQLELYGHSGDGENAEELLACAPVADDPRMRAEPFALNANYCIQAAEGLGGNHVTLAWTDSEAPVTLLGDTGDPPAMCVLMTMAFIETYEGSGKAGVEVAKASLTRVEQGE